MQTCLPHTYFLTYWVSATQEKYLINGVNAEKMAVFNIITDCTLKVDITYSLWTVDMSLQFSFLPARVFTDRCEVQRIDVSEKQKSVHVHNLS